MVTLPESSRLNEAVFRLVGYLLVSAMLTCAVVTFVQFGTTLATEWRAGYLPVFAFALSLERLYTYRRLKKLPFLERSWINTYLVQWVVILLTLKLVVSISHGMESFRQQLLVWRIDFFGTFFNSETLLGLLLTIGVWALCGAFAETLDEMGLNQALIAREALSSGQHAPLSPRERLLSMIFSIGGVLVLLTALARLNLRALFAGETRAGLQELPPLAGAGGSTLLYFMLGLALLSLTQFISLHTRWALQGIPVRRDLAARWAFYGLLFLLVLAGIVSLLPTSYSLGLLSVLGYLLDVAIALLSFLVGLLWVLIAFLLGLPFLLFGRPNPVGTIQMPPPPLMPENVAPPQVAAPLPWWELAKSILFWAIFLGVILYSLAHYLRQHEEILAALQRLPGLAWLGRFVDWVIGLFRGAGERLSETMEAGRARWRSRRQAEGQKGWGRLINLRKLTPRQRVRFYYLALIRRGDETGLARRGAQTPLEYAASLERTLPELNAEIDGLTGSFVEARYSNHAIEETSAGRVRAYWERIRTALRGWKRQK